jgi:hypothetical protein
MKNDLNRLSEH